MSSYWEIAIGRVSLCPKLLGESSFESPVLCQAMGEFQLVGSCFAPTCCGHAISRLVSCVKLLGNYNLQGLAL